ncbi:MAG: DUF4199 domain-containing protein [Calditrichia bacterium]
MNSRITKFGLGIGLMLVVTMIGPVMVYGPDLNFTLAEIFGWASILFSMVFLFIGIKGYRDNEAGGHISFGGAFKVGALIAIIASTIIGGFTGVLFASGQADQFSEVAREHYADQIRSSDMTQEQKEQELRDMGEMQGLFMNPAFQAMVAFFTYLPVGIVFSLIFAWYLKT